MSFYRARSSKFAWSAVTASSISKKSLWRELVEEWELQPHEEAAQIQALSVIEVNAAGTRFPYPKILSWHQLHCFPQLDLQ